MLIGLLIQFLFPIGTDWRAFASSTLPPSKIKIIKGEYSERDRVIKLEWDIEKGAVLATRPGLTKIDEIKIQVTIQQAINRVEIKEGLRECGRFTGECLHSSLSNRNYANSYFDDNSLVALNSQPVANAKFGIFTPDSQRFTLIDGVTEYTSGLKYTLTVYNLLGKEGAGSVVKAGPFTVPVKKISSGIDTGPRIDTKAYYDQFFNQSCSTAISGKCSTFRDLLIQEDRCRNLDTGKNEEGAGFWLYIPSATKQAANLAVDRRPGFCLRLSKVIKYQGAIFNGATDTWNAFYFSAQNSPKEITDLFTNGIFTTRLDDFGPDCPQAIRILERGCPTFAINVSSLTGSETSSLFENNAVKAFVTVSQGTYFGMINKLYKPDGSGPYSQDHGPQSDNLDDEALKKYKINTAFSGDSPAASGGGDTQCEAAFKGSYASRYLIGPAICGTLEFIAGAAVAFANWALNIMIYSSGLQ